MRVECRNFNYQHSRPSYFTQRDLEIAHLLDRHVMLTTSQIKALGYPVRRLGHMVKYGFLYHYCLHLDDETIWHVYAVGHTARRYLGVFCKYFFPVFADTFCSSHPGEFTCNFSLKNF